jgi:HK97 family phage prohead protease
MNDSIATTPPTHECRVLLMADCRIVKGEDGKATQLVGYAAVFDKLSEDLGGFRERIRPGAFSKVIKTCDCRALFNHDANHVLGRNVAGTLRLAEDEQGLRAEIDLPDTALGRDLPVLIERKDITGMSFTFVTGADAWDYTGAVVIRELIEIKELYDVGPVVYPAYTDTSIAARALESNRPAPAPITSPARNRAALKLRLAEAG